MVTNDEGIVRFKHNIMEEVCRLAWAGNLNEESKNELVMKTIPGPKPMFRCCIYKEREIVRERIRLACAQNTSDNEGSKNVVQVIGAACDECPLSAYSVTDNCRFCMGKACLNSCKFGAISPGEVRMHIDPQKCKECGMCSRACPYSAIVHLQRPCKKVCPVGAITYDENGLCKIDESKCINCGHCIHSCPFGAIGSKTYLVPIIEAILAGKEVIAMVAPAIEGQFGENIDMAALRAAFKKLGFADMVEVGLGGDMTAAYESLEWSEALEEGRKMTTSCCPAFINMLRKHFPEQFEANMSSTVSPMCAVSRYLKLTHPGCVTVFVGPCIAKKSEAQDKSVPDNADYVITFGELGAFFRSKDIKLEPVEDSYQEASAFGKKFASSGGVAAAVLECIRERGGNADDIKLYKAAGGDDCRRTLLMLKAGKFTDDFIEGMVCPGGCVGGPSKRKTEQEITKARNNLLAKADDRKIIENLRDYPMDQFSMHRDGSNDLEMTKRVMNTAE
ncbi:4Fe-4S dicluster domain-containing protein [Butyrivibrio sp. MC2013]|uniref:4Fe-4S dicluster domain-containing protein n=1 Tax=Butyrivibrio sp. MC2013 TaxID=1280686 RepID=UPI000400E8C6|nr:4Fe-4S dicluster domain-containing protein [Butyrivibrio sp. MC2013]